jgi:hypothetical protein
MARLILVTPSSIATRDLGAFLASPPPLEGAEGALLIAPLEGDAIALGSFEIARSTLDLERLELPLVRRATGGPPIRVRTGQVHLALHLRAPGVLGGVADPNRVLNRHVRPLLHALATIGAQVSSGGRDIVLSRGAPVGWIGARHCRASSETGIEAIVAVSSDFSVPPALDLAQGSIAPRFLGKSPSTLAAVGGPAEGARVVSAIVDAYRALAEGSVTLREGHAAPPDRVDLVAPPFDAMVEEAIGLLGARVDAQRVLLGGDLMASHDALEALGRALHALGHDCEDAALFACIDAHLSPPSGAMLIGVRHLSSIAKVVRAAWATKTKARG